MPKNKIYLLINFQFIHHNKSIDQSQYRKNRKALKIHQLLSKFNKIIKENWYQKRKK